MSDGSGSVTVVDGVGRSVSLDAPPQRIISLVPSTTETLAALGAGPRLVGRTRYCVHPQPWVEGIPSVGGTKNPDLEAIVGLGPDLLLGNEEENRPALWPALEPIAPLYVAYPRTVDDALNDLTATAQLVDAEERGRQLVEAIAAERAKLAAGAEPFRYAYLIWRRPWMTLNDDTFVAALLKEAGGENVFGGSSNRYPPVDLDALRAADPDVILLPDEPFPFAAEHVPELEELAPRARLVDGECLCWHGVHLLEGLPYLAGLRLPETARRGGGA